LHRLADQLRGDGYDVVLAHSGEESLELLGAQPVDCILLDLVMPGLGGCETCRRIKAVPTLRDVPLIMLTAMEDREAMIGALGAGADDYIQKSSEFEVLTARVRAQLRRKQFEDEHRRIREQLLARELEAAEARSAAALAETRATLIAQLERKNEELEAFSYSVSHDLRAPLRSIDGFSQALMEDCADQIDETGADHIRRVRAATQRMGELIDDLLSLSKVGRADLRREPIDLAEIASSIAADLARKEPERAVAVDIADALHVEADGRLLRAALENLVGNAWKFTSREPEARIEIGCETREGARAFFVRDNGDGFDPKYAARLFQPFQRLHTEEQFPGTGIGLATVRRIVERHRGRVWAEGEVGVGATVWFTIDMIETEPVS
jgi:light-regulated signal transduction histidine kinase (bacteriophytochrome)